MKRLILAGGGHAHLLVLQQLTKHPRPDLDVVLISPSRWQYYSGMLPGWIAGYYRLEECRVDLVPLVKAAGARFIIEPIAGMNADRQCVCPPDGRHIEYDWLSLNVGSESDLTWLSALGSRLLPVKPWPEFLLGWKAILEAAGAHPAYRLLVIGGGAAGVELASAARTVLRKVSPSSSVALITGNSGLLSDHAPGVQIKVRHALQRADISVIPNRAVGAEHGVLLDSGERLTADKVIAATGARAPVWLTLSGLQLDSAGYVQVDAYHRSHSHPTVYAVGDVGSRSDVRLSRSGVHAVRVAPVLAHNLLAAIDGAPLRPYRPRHRVLYLLALGERRAVASWGPLSSKGAWVWRWKDWIDRRFIRQFANPMPQAVKSEVETET
ncbi:MAG: FAD-dependent oxidoreductase [Steroidobacteraceae bacterium]